VCIGLGIVCQHRVVRSGGIVFARQARRAWRGSLDAGRGLVYASAAGVSSTADRMLDISCRHCVAWGASVGESSLRCLGR